MTRLFSLFSAGLVVVTGIAPARAAVTYTGTVTPAVNPGDVLTVGPTDNDPPDVDPRGSVTVDGGSELVATRVLVGDHPAALSRTLVSGFGSKLSATEDGSEFTPTLGVGRAGSGYLRIEDGAWVEVGAIDQQRGVMTIGQPADGNAGAPGVSTVEVSGPTSLLTVGRQLVVNGGPASSLLIDDGGVVRVGSFGQGSVAVQGRVEVAGLGSELQTSRLLLGPVNGEGSTGQDGELTIRSGAVVRQTVNDNGFAQIGPGGRIVLDGGVLALPVGGVRLLEGMTGAIEGSGSITERVGVNFGGTVSAGAGDHLHFQSSLTTTGEILVTDADLTVSGLFVTNNLGEYAGVSDFLRSDVSLLGGYFNGGTMRVEESTLRLARGDNGSALRQDGILSSTRSVIRLDDELLNTGRIELVSSTLDIRNFQGISNQGGNFDPARLVLDDATISSTVCCTGIDNDGVIEARSGENRVAAAVRGSGSLVVGAGASIRFDLADFFGGASLGSGATARFSQDSQLADLSVTVSDFNLAHPSLIAESDLPPDFDEAALFVNGTLTIDLDDLSGVEAAQEYKLIEADRLDASFSDFDLPGLPGTLEFLPTLTETSLSLVVIDTTQELPGDFNADGAVDAADYTVWRDGLAEGVTNWVDHQLWLDNFGRVLDAPGPLSVPEPASAWVALGAALAMISRSRRGFRRAAQVGQVLGDHLLQAARH